MDKLKEYMEENGYREEFIEELVIIGKEMVEELRDDVGRNV